MITANFSDMIINKIIDETLNDMSRLSIKTKNENIIFNSEYHIRLSIKIACLKAWAACQKYNNETCDKLFDKMFPYYESLETKIANQPFSD